MELFESLDKKWLALAIIIIFALFIGISHLSIFKREAAYREMKMEADLELEKIDEMVREITG